MADYFIGGEMDDLAKKTQNILEEAIFSQLEFTSVRKKE